MTDALKKALEESNLSESAKVAITEAWTQKLEVAREELAASLRDEFAVKFEKDKTEIVEALDLMVRESIETHVSELEEAKKACKVSEVEDKKKMKAKMKVMESFIQTQLVKEISEFKADRQGMVKQLQVMDDFIKESLSKELEEFNADRQLLAEERVQHKINAKKELAEAKKQFVSKASKICESFVRENITNEMTQLKTDLIEAKKKHFGMKIFEAFAAEFGSSFFSERKEVNKLSTVIDNLSTKLEESATSIAKKDRMINEATNKLRISEDRFARTNTMNKLCSSLAGSKRKLMEELLEKVPTNKLTESFKTYLPSVVSQETKAINETRSVAPQQLVEHTGNKPSTEQSEKSSIKEVVGNFHKINQFSSSRNV